MGLPLGTFALGIIASIYMGRRERRTHFNLNEALPTLRKTALITAAVTTLAALPIGLLALNEQNILTMLETLSGCSQVSLRGYAGFALIGLLCLFLFILQYWFSNKAGQLVFKMKYY